MKVIKLIFFSLIISYSAFAQEKIFNNSNVGLDYGYNMYYNDDTSQVLDGITWGGRITKILPLDKHDAFHVGMKLSYHSRNVILNEIGQVKRQNMELGFFVGWNDVGDQVYISGRYSYFIQEKANLIGLELRLEPFNKFIRDDIELMFYGLPHIITKREMIPMAGITLGLGVVYHINKKNLFNPENFYN